MTVELVTASGLGLPEGTAAAVERAYRTLVDEDVLVIVGPAIGDNALAVTPLVERLQVPTLNWSGAERARGEHMFQVQVGSHEDESVVLARHLASIGARRLGVVLDRSPIGRRHLEFLQDEAEVLGLQIATTASVSPLAETADGRGRQPCSRAGSTPWCTSVSVCRPRRWRGLRRRPGSTGRAR